MKSTNKYYETFFDKGFLTKIKIFEKQHIDKIFEDYLNFTKSCKSRSDSVESKTKTHLFFSWANKIIFEKKIIDIVESIIGKNIICWNSLIFHKKPRTKNFVSMHQDQNYWNIKMDKGLTVSLALTDSSIENGCLRIIPYSHKKKYTHIDLNDKSNMLGRGQTIDFANENVENKIENLELERGECSIFHGNIVHGSLENKSDNHRVLYAMRFLTPDNKINTSLYYNYGTLVSGENSYGNFINEPSLNETTLISLRKLHNEIIISQFSKYLKLIIKNKFLVNFFMIFFKINFFRSCLYIFRKKF